MKKKVYFAINKYGEFMYVLEKYLTEEKKNACDFADLLNDRFDFKKELTWSCKKPTAEGMYGAVVQYTQLAEDDFVLNAIECDALLCI